MRVPVLVLAFIGLLVVACGDTESSREDICIDRSWDECGGIAERECGLSGTASDAQLSACEAFVQCENASFDACMSE